MPGILDRETDWGGDGITGGGGGGPMGGPMGGGNGSEYADPTVAETGTLQILLSEGPVEGLVDGLKSVYLDGTPIQNGDGSFNFKGIALSLVAGTNTQSAVKGITGTESETNVGVQVVQATPVVRTISSNPSGVRVRIAIPALKVVSTTDGNSTGHSVTVKIERKHATFTSGAWQDVPLQGGGVITGGPFSTKYTRSYRVDTPVTGSWDIRVTRVSADDADAYHQSQTWWEAYTEIVDARLRYPNSSVLSLRVNAKQFRSIPQVNVLMKGVKVDVPKNYDPVARTYATTGPGTSGGTWDGTFKEAWTDNPAWTFYAASSKVRWGAGTFLNASGLDKWTLYQIAQWADTMVDDGHGGTEPRMTCNLYLQGQQNAIKALGQLASIFWGVIYYASGLVIPVPDSDDAPAAPFTNANVEGGKFSYEGTARQARHTAAIVKFNNPDLAYSSDAAVYEDEAGIARYGYNPLDLQGIGCTSQGQALRLAKWAILSELMAPETVAFSSGLEGSTVKPGDVIQVADQFRAGNTRAGGRVLDPFAVNLVQNGDSEDYAPTGYGAVGVSTDLAYAGTRSRKVTSNGTFVSSQIADFAVTPGDSYSINLMAYCNAGITSQATIEFKDSGGSWLAAKIDTGVGGVGAGWVPMTATGVVPAGAATAYVFLYAIGTLGGNAYFDNIYARKLANPSTVYLDAPVTMAAGTYTLRVQTATGMESRTVTTGAGTVSTLTVSPAFSSAPAEGAGWLLQKNSEASLWRVLSVKKGDGIKHDVIALKHDPAKYTALGLAAGDVITRTPATITAPAPSGLAVTSVSRILNDRQQLTLQANWTIDGAVAYSAQARRDKGPWEAMSVSGASAYLDGIQPGVWDVRVAGDWRKGGVSPWVTVSATVTASGTQPTWVATATSAAAYADALARQFNLVKNGNSEMANPTGLEANGVSSAFSRNGTKCLRLDGVTNFPKASFPVSADEQLYIEAWGYCNSAGQGGSVSLEFQNAAGAWMGGGVFPAFTTGLGAWHKVSGSITVPAGAVTCFVYCYSSGGTGTTWIDDLYVCRKISAGMLEADLALLGVVRSPSFTYGTSSAGPVGFQLSGPAFTTTYIGGSTDANCHFELEGNANFGGYKVATVNDRLFTAYNRILNGSFYTSLNGWQMINQGADMVYSASSHDAGSGSAAMTASTTASAAIIQPFNCPKNTGTFNLTLSTACSATLGNNITATVKVYLFKAGTETLLATYTYSGAQPASPSWTARTIDVSSYVNSGGDFVLRIVHTLATPAGDTVTVYTDKVNLTI